MRRESIAPVSVCSVGHSEACTAIPPPVLLRDFASFVDNNHWLAICLCSFVPNPALPNAYITTNSQSPINNNTATLWLIPKILAFGKRREDHQELKVILSYNRASSRPAWATRAHSHKHKTKQSPPWQCNLCLW